MTIVYDVSEQDYVNFNLYHMKHSRQAKRVMLLEKYGYALVLAAACYVGGEFYIGALCAGAILALAWILVYPKYRKNRVSRMVKRHINEGKTNDFIGHQELTLNEDCIDEVSPGTTSQTKYSVVERIGCDYDCIFLYIGAIKAFIIPLSAFSNDEQKEEFFAILKDRTGLVVSS